MPSQIHTSRRRTCSRLLLNLLVAAGVAGCGNGTTATPSFATTNPIATQNAASPGTGASAGLPAFAHVYVIVLENEEYGSIIGGQDAPYLNGLAGRYATAGSFFGETHPSQPNYFALFSGSTQGVTDDGVHDLDAPNLADQIEAKGKTWAVFAQDYPGDCFKGASKGGTGEGGGATGSYARKHNPAISFTSISSNPARCARVQNLTAFDPAAADFEMIIPNQCNDMHSCPVATGDAFLQGFVPKITGSPAFVQSLLFITLDEGSTNDGGGGHIATLVISPLVKPGYRSEIRYDHYSILRTIEDAWDLGCLARSCDATAMADFFAPSAP